jgi:hypothetical protein
VGGAAAVPHASVPHDKPARWVPRTHATSERAPGCSSSACGLGAAGDRVRTQERCRYGSAGISGATHAAAVAARAPGCSSGRSRASVARRRASGGARTGAPSGKLPAPQNGVGALSCVALHARPRDSGGTPRPRGGRTARCERCWGVARREARTSEEGGVLFAPHERQVSARASLRAHALV